MSQRIKQTIWSLALQFSSLQPDFSWGIGFSESANKYAYEFLNCNYKYRI